MISGERTMSDNNQFVKIVRFVEAVLQRCNVPAHLDGFGYIAESVACKVLHNPRKWTDIYSFVADLHGIFRHSVSRSVNYIVHTHFGEFCMNFGLNENTATASSVIATLALYVRHNLLADPISEVAATRD